MLHSIPQLDESCPSYGEGIADGTLPDDTIEKYASFVLVSDPITLAAEDGSTDCYPFADSVDPIDNYPESNYPQCEKPNSTDGVCAIQYTAAADATCANRRYGLNSYPSAEEAESAGAVVTHGGPCGVCSNTEDFAMRLMNADIFQTTAVLCSVSYTLDRDFKGLPHATRINLGLPTNVPNCGLIIRPPMPVCVPMHVRQALIMRATSPGRLQNVRYRNACSAPIPPFKPISTFCWEERGPNVDLQKELPGRAMTFSAWIMIPVWEMLPLLNPIVQCRLNASLPVEENLE